MRPLAGKARIGGGTRASGFRKPSNGQCLQDKGMVKDSRMSVATELLVVAK